MSEPESKIKIKMGMIEIEYEGPTDFFRKEVHDFIISISKVGRDLGLKALDSGSKAQHLGKDDAEPGTLGTTKNVAAKLAAKSGTELIMAAAAFLTFALKKEKFSRKELLDEMKKATGYYKKSFSTNLSNYLKQLIDTGKLAETAQEVYTLTPTSSAELKAKLA